MLRPGLLAAVILGMAASSGWAQEHGDGRSGGAGASVGGRVRDAETGAPVEGALVTATGERSRVQALTDPAGRYRLEDSPTGSLVLTVERIGYAVLRVDSVRVDSEVEVDFALTPEPVALAPLTVNGHGSRAVTALLDRGSAIREAAGHTVSLWTEREHTDPFAPALIAAAPVSGKKGSGPGGPRVVGGSGLGVRGPLDRHGATYVDGAPAQLSGPASFLADPFAATGRRWRVWDAGAPARVTGGLEYVMDAQDLPPPDGRGPKWRARMDLVRGAMDAWWERPRVAAEVSAGSTLPWVASMIGEGGHVSRTAGVHAWAVPAPRQRATMSLSSREESLPFGGDPGLPSAHMRESTGALGWEAELVRGVLSARIGAARSHTSLPPGGTDAGAAPVLSVGETRSYVGVEYRRAVGESVAFGLGGDRLDHGWSGSAAARAATWGLYGEAAWTPGSRLSLRVGSRLDIPSEGGGAEAAPRAQLDWRVLDGVHLTVGSGVHHQTLLAWILDAVPGSVRPVMARGVHHRVTAVVEAGGLDLRGDLYAKRLSNLPGPNETMSILGTGLGLDLPLGGSGRLGFVASLERRRQGGVDSWSRTGWASLDHTLPGSLYLQLHLGASQNAGGLILPGPSADTMGVAGSGTLARPGQSRGPWSLRSDGELSRVVHRGGDAPVRIYVQLLNALGDELRPLFVEAAGARDTRVPRVLVLGIAVGAERRHLSRPERLAR